DGIRVGHGASRGQRRSGAKVKLSRVERTVLHVLYGTRSRPSRPPAWKGNGESPLAPGFGPDWNRAGFGTVFLSRCRSAPRLTRGGLPFSDPRREAMPGRTARSGRKETRAGCFPATPSPAESSVTMPLVQVTVIEGVFSEAQKQELIHRLTDAMVAV